MSEPTQTPEAPATRRFTVTVHDKDVADLALSTVYVVTYNTDDENPSSEVYATAELAAEATCRAIRGYFAPVEDDPSPSVNRFLNLCDQGRWLDAWEHYRGMGAELKDGDTITWEAVAVKTEVSA